MEEKQATLADLDPDWAEVVEEADAQMGLHASYWDCALYLVGLTGAWRRARRKADTTFRIIDFDNVFGQLEAASLNLDATIETFSDLCREVGVTPVDREWLENRSDFTQIVNLRRKIAKLQKKGALPISLQDLD